jgi:hypothetical protein
MLLYFVLLPILRPDVHGPCCNTPMAAGGEVPLCCDFAERVFQSKRVHGFRRDVWWALTAVPCVKSDDKGDARAVTLNKWSLLK